MQALRARLGNNVDTAEALGWSAKFMEAEAFAYLAVRSERGLPLTFAGTTGVARPLTGGVRSPIPARGTAASATS
jgi:anhydro-N-acetylmuramic acid kinase